MIKTISVVIGLFIAVLFFVFVSVIIPRMLSGEHKLEILNLKNRTAGHNISVTWETNEMANAIIHYTYDSKDYNIKDLEFKTTHKVVMENIMGTVSYYAESCDIFGKCDKSESKTVTT